MKSANMNGNSQTSQFTEVRGKVVGFCWNCELMVTVIREHRDSSRAKRNCLRHFSTYQRRLELQALCFCSGFLSSTTEPVSWCSRQSHSARANLEWTRIQSGFLFRMQIAVDWIVFRVRLSCSSEIRLTLSLASSRSLDPRR